MMLRQTLAAAALALTATTAAPAVEVFVPGDFATIQGAIDNVANGDVITVGPGTYFEAVDFVGKRITLRSSDGPETTIIDATGFDAPAVTFASTEDEFTRMFGFTITGGSGRLVGSARKGGGIYIVDTTPVIERCIIRGNSADEGAGVFMSATLFPVTMRNCVIADNQAQDGGGLAVRFFSGLTMLNCTVTNNAAIPSFKGGGGQGGGLLADENCVVNVSNSIIHGNVPDAYAGGDVPIARYSNIEGGVPGGVGVIDEIPLFMSPDSGNYDLQSISPCIDSGDSLAAVELIETDVVSNPRAVDDPAREDTGLGVFGIVIDMGAYERQVQVVTTCLGDINGDDLVGFLDLVELIAAWGPCP